MGEYKPVPAYTPCPYPANFKPGKPTHGKFKVAKNRLPNTGQIWGW